MYKHKNPNWVTGYRGKSYDDQNLNKLPKEVLTRLEQNGVIELIKESKKNDNGNKPEKQEKPKPGNKAEANAKESTEQKATTKES